MPPLQALVALHFTWLLVLVPAVVGLARRGPPGVVWRVGAAAFGVGAMGLALVILREWLTWLPLVPPEEKRYFPQRVLYVLATLTDWPIAEFIVAGVVTWFLGRRRLAAK